MAAEAPDFTVSPRFASKGVVNGKTLSLEERRCDTGLAMQMYLE